jgi:c-di-AMP phosphodiesterase-like protein
MLLGAETMPSYLKEYSIKSPLYGMLAAGVLLLGVLAYYNWVIALVGLLILAGLFYLTLRMVEKKQRKTEEYITTLSYRLKKVGEEALLEMPIGIMLFNEDYYIEWTNPFLASCVSEDSLAGRSLYDVADSIVPLIKQEIETETLTLHDRKFKVVHKRDERLLYFFDVTEQVEIEKLYEDERTAIAIILLDNYDDLTQGMEDQRKSSINSLVTSLLINGQGIMAFSLNGLLNDSSVLNDISSAAEGNSRFWMKSGNDGYKMCH